MEVLIRTIALLTLIPSAALTGCGPATADSGTARADSGDLAFDVRTVDLGHTAAAVRVVDLDGDGALDVVVTGEGRVTVLVGDGAGGLELRAVMAAGENPVDLAAGDLDGDGRLDLVVANHETRYLTLLLGGSDGPGSGRTERLAIDVSPHPHAVAVVDIDGDGRPDILVDDRDRDRLMVYRGTGGGAFRAGPPIPVGGDPYRGMAVADVDGDGHPDVVTPNPRSVAVRLGDGAGGFGRGTELESGAMPPFSAAVGDFDGDGHGDVAAGSGEGPGGVVVWLGDGTGAFHRWSGSPYAVARGPTALETADVDGNGIDDLLITSYPASEVAVLLGGRDAPRVVRIGLDDRAWGIAAGDLNGDGRTDLVTVHDAVDRVTVLLQVTGSDGDRSP